MNKEGSAYGKGFVIRVLVLLGVMAAVVGGYYYDRDVLVPGAEKKMLEVQDLANKRGEDGKRISREKVHEVMGSWASRTSREYTQVRPDDLAEGEEFNAKTFDIETYQFRRIVPGLARLMVEFAFLEDEVVFSQSSIPISDKQLNTGFEDGNKIKGIQSDRSGGGAGGGRMPPRGAGGARGGGGRPGGGDAGNAKGNETDSDNDKVDSDTEKDD